MEEGERLAALEIGHQGLHNDVQKLAEAFSSFGREVRGAMEDVKKQISEQNRTPWGTLAAWASVILVVLGIIGTFYVRDLKSLKDQTLEQRSEILSYEKESYERQLEIMERFHKIELENARRQ